MSLPRVRLVLDLVTDAFVGGAAEPCDKRSDDLGAEGLRPPSLRGLLRFCWRACHGHLGLEELASREAQLFGSVEGRAAQGVTIRTRALELAVVPPSPPLAPGERPTGRQPYREGDLAYLGYGVADFRGRRQRPAMQAGASFEVTIAGRQLATPAANGLADALWLLGAIVGCGSRSRRGWGSLQVAGWDGSEPPAPWPARCETPEELRDAWCMFLARFKDRPERPEWTALGAGTRVFVWEDTFRTWEEALGDAGQALKRFRVLYGADFGRGKPVGPDHDLVYAFADGEEVGGAPARAAFGLPHNYQLTDGGTNTGNRAYTVNVEPTGVGDRRASPLFFHVARLRGGAFVPVVAYLPARFLPAGAQLEMRGVARRDFRRAARGPLRVDAPSDGAVREFLDGAEIEQTRGGRPLTERWSGLSHRTLEARP